MTRTETSKLVDTDSKSPLSPQEEKILCMISSKTLSDATPLTFLDELYPELAMQIQAIEQNVIKATAARDSKIKSKINSSLPKKK